MVEKPMKNRRGRPKGAKVDTATILQVIAGSGGIVATIAEKLNVTRTTFYNYLKDIPEVAQAVEDEKEAMLDMAEGSLFGLIESGDLGAICFYLKCKGKQRGYIEKQEIVAEVNNRSTIVAVPETFGSVEEWEAFTQKKSS